MPRGRPKKIQSVASPKEVIDNINYSFDYRNFDQQQNWINGSMIDANGWYNNPQWMNNIIKQISGLPQKYDRDTILKYLENPIYNEKPLKDLAQYLYVNIQPFQRIIQYFTRMLDFRYYIYPTNVYKEKEFNSPAYKKSKKNVLDWLSKFDVKKEFSYALFVSLLEDTGFWYLREGKDHHTLQRLPSDYCLITNRGELGYVYAFNMVYFLTPGVSLDNFAPEFREWYVDFLNGDKSIPFYWKELPPDKAFAFKWNENFAATLPPLLGMYLSSLQITEFEELVKTKTVMDNFKILLQKIPMRTDKDAKRNDMLIDKDSALNYHRNLKAQCPPGTAAVTTPMDVTAVSFEKGVQTRDDIVNYGTDNFFNRVGSSRQLFNPEKGGNIGVKLGAKKDESYVTFMYNQFKKFIDVQLKRVSGQYTFEIDFMDSTIISRDDLITSTRTDAQSGMPVARYAGACGMTPIAFNQLIAEENASGIKEKMKPLQMSSTMSGKDSTDKGGRPQVKEENLSDEGIATRNADSNEGR